ncbi:endoplasmic oxidoreductin-1-like [Stylonychia lemnae]|uniref:Endoplasmic oxidoreductin-1-like n=1 Tax=Stylonychia lemnae TaxID=5949 RepID=A0A078AJ33_STYLE|nr:endoplasmic oxidoreductin-1-like [Stylonychia lemnae]|eukprot:CDW81901.1 endoplasmic oxidoreductin-1-like [Stylonychia lemnae]
MIRNVLIIGVIFTVIYVKMFLGVYNKDELSEKVYTDLLGKGITGKEILLLSQSIDGYIKDLKKIQNITVIEAPDMLFQEKSKDGYNLNKPITSAKSLKNLRIKERNRDIQFVQDMNQSSSQQNSETSQIQQQRLLNLLFNAIEYNGHSGSEIWEYIFDKILKVNPREDEYIDASNRDDILISLISGLKSSLDMKIATSMVDNQGFSLNQLQISDHIHNLVGQFPERVKGLYLYYGFLLKKVADKKEQFKNLDESFNSQRIWNRLVDEIENVLKLNSQFSKININQEESLIEIQNVLNCIENRDCHICKLHLMLFLNSLKNLDDSVENLKFGESIRSYRGLIISILASLYILDFYTKRQMEFDINKRDEKIRKIYEEKERKLKEQDEKERKANKKANGLDSSEDEDKQVIGNILDELKEKQD